MIKGKDYENGSYLWKIYEGILLSKVSGEELEVNKIMVHSCGYCMKRFLVHKLGTGPFLWMKHIRRIRDWLFFVDIAWVDFSSFSI